jgi:ParB family transcriptional regulator, chromosome partitioning protein
MLHGLYAVRNAARSLRLRIVQGMHDFPKQGVLMLTRKVVSVDPHRCRVWPLHDRLMDQVNEASCAAEIQSFKNSGQMIAALGRPLHGDPDHDVEIIYGVRRLFVASLVQKPLIVELRELTDRQAIVALDLENRQRQDLSPYERGLSFTRWLRSGQFDSQEEMASALQVSTAHVSRLLKLARLPSVVVSAFGSGAQIRETWGLELIDALDDPDRRRSILRAARTISSAASRPAAAEVRDRLLAVGTGNCHPRPTQREVVIKDSDGAPLFRIKRQSHSMIYLLPPDRLTPAALERIERMVAGILAELPAYRTQERKSLIGGHKLPCDRLVTSLT